MTAVPANPRVSELRDLFRYLSDFRATFEATGLEEITTPYGNTWSLWDLEYLLRATELLTLRQRQAITLCLIHGVKESDAAEDMGVSRTNPVMMYATLGLQRLLDMVDAGQLERFRAERQPGLAPLDDRTRHAQAIAMLAKEIRDQLVEFNDCWLYPNRSSRPPRLMIRSRTAWNGYIPISPMQVLWLDEIGPVPPGCNVEHSERIVAASIACSNPHHGELLQPPQRQAHLQTLAARYVRSRGVA